MEPESSPVYSAEITEIIGTPPRWIIRVGGGLLLVIFLACLGLASVIRVPEQSTLPVFISGAIQPYYVVRPAGTGGRPAAASGKVVERGQLLLYGADGHTAGGVPAPFTGRLLLQDQRAAASPGDTIGVFTPLHNTYRFRGRADLAQAKKLAGSRALPIEVALSGRTNERLVLHGHLGFINPSVHNGHVSYVGQLDSLSNGQLAQHMEVVTNLAGVLAFANTRKPLLQSLFN